MKDYSYSYNILCKHKEESEDYFLFYEKKDGKIIVHLAGGSVKEFTYSKETENIILERMELQVLKYGESLINNYEIDAEELIERASPFVLLSSFGSITMIDASLLFSILNYSVLSGCSLLIGYGGIEYYYSKYLKKDYVKHKLFLDNKELIQSSTYRDLRPLVGVNKKALKEARQNLDEDQASININTIRLFKKKEINSIINYIKDNKKIYSFKRE
ncbi:MAG: hypothetical protein IKF36_01880 [Bacilli bacterium]|nr:hypothetical protein [Bacilli bacterium]